MLFIYMKHIYLLQYCDHQNAVSAVCGGGTRTVVMFLSYYTFYLMLFRGLK